LSGGIGTPGISPIKAGATGSAGKSYNSNLTEQEQKVATQLTNEQLREFRSFADRATRDQSFVRVIGRDARDGQDLASRLSTATSRVESAQAIYSERQAVANRLSTSYESGEVLSIDLAQLPANSHFMQHYQRLAAEYGSESLALQAAMASELATRALPPTRISSQNGALPASFSEIRSAHQADAQDPAFASLRVKSAGNASDRAAGPVISTAPLNAPDVPGALGGLRSDITSRAAAAASTPADADSFDQRNHITRNPDGTVGTKRSQMSGNARQLREDFANMTENARALIAEGSTQALTAAEEARARNAQSQRARDKDSTSEVPTMLPSGGRRTKR
jgi:conjugal transfer mating pair stabilization protein TraG